MPRTELTRRRFIAVSAAAAGALACGGAARAAARLVEWRGVALGAAASIRLAHPDRAAAQDLLHRCVAEIARLEKIFSLYRPDSEVCRLNTAGRLAAPSLELVEVLSAARQVSAASDGAFDVTVQPLWLLFRDHFANPGANQEGPPVAETLALVDWREVEVDTSRIALRRPGMAVTLNGIAQGYITDRVADLLHRAGMTSVLMDLGEVCALGRRPEGPPWQVGLADPARPGRIVARLGLEDAALATSGAYGSPFEASGRYNHLIDPRSGRTAPVRRAVSVLAPKAMLADAASTALALLPDAAAPELLRRLGAGEAWIQDDAGLRVLRG